MSSGKARVVGGLSLLPYQSDDDWLRGGRPVGQQTLDRVAAHVTQGRTFAVITRLVDRDLLVAFAPSAPLVGANPETGGELFRFPGRNGFRWAIGHRAARICRWGIGYQPLVFRPTSDQPRRIQWVVPAGTEALAIGFEHVAIRIGSQTFLYTIGGEPLQGSALIEWDEGLFVDDFLVLTRRRHDERGSPGVWVVHTDAWLPVWCSVEGPHGPEVR